ncbi:MAG: ribosome biogenesis GTP-binding protein YihA/YsxC [Bacteroidota bacterium]|nr:ribosome biogenesis GTP-binding protein YihA/YsxC [Bacteroidota bacterium]
MKINTSEFLMSNTDPGKCPKPDKPEYAFIGRSNVGKSSLINMITGRKALAKISGKPGKTQLINHFLINESWYLVDLPGYGYAKIGKSHREKWMLFIMNYIRNRENLMCLFVLIDSRIEPQKIDLEFTEMLGEYGIPFNLVFTKTDKISPNKTQMNISAFKAKMLETWEDTPDYHISSARTGTGKKEILGFIEKTNKEF